MLAGQDAGAAGNRRQCSLPPKIPRTSTYGWMTNRPPETSTAGPVAPRVEPRLTQAPSWATPSGLIDLDAIATGWQSRGLELRFRR
jgi:hypothetical protein